MGRHNLEYPTGARNTVVRSKKRATYDLGKVHRIIQETPVLHVSFSPSPEEPFPVILPMIGVMGSFASPSADLDEALDCYLHGYVSSRIMNVARASPTGQGLPVCIAATKVDGLVLSLTPNSHSYNYRSAVLFGHAQLVTDADEKLWAMQAITNKVVPGRWPEARVPPNPAEMSSTTILRVVIESGSGKVRDQGPGDERCDLEDEEVMRRVWTGVVPMVETLAEPVPSAYNLVKEVPAHVVQYVDRFNKRSEAYKNKVNANVNEMKRYSEI